MFRFLAVVGFLGSMWAVAATAAPTQLIRPGAVWRHHSVTSAGPPEGWTAPGFSDGSWADGRAGFSAGYYGYYQAASTPGLLPGAGGAMPAVVLFRHAFAVDDPAAIRRLWLRLEYDDGVRGWLNGVEIFRRGFPPEGDLPWNATPIEHPLGPSELIDLSAFRGLLAPGTNVMALQLADSITGGGTLFLWPELRANFGRGPAVENVSSNRVEIRWQSAPGAGARVEIEAVESPASAWFLETAGDATGEAMVRVDGLTEGTEYAYRVHLRLPEGDAATERAAFRTLRSAGDVEFLVFGDSGSGLVNQHLLAEAMVEESGDLVLHTGDIVYPGFTAGRMDLRCQSVYEPLRRRVPFFFTVGNHDVYGSLADYIGAFRQPTNEVTGTSHYYSFDHGDVHFVSLFVPQIGFPGLGLADPARGPADQYRWLTNDLARSDKPWKVVFFHQAARSSGPHRIDDYNLNGRPDPLELQEILLPVCRRYGVQVVFTGHEHFWERFAPVGGAHFVVTGGGGGVLYLVYQRDPESARVDSRLHFVRARLRAGTLRLEAVGEDGRVFDGFSIRQSPEAPAEWSATWHTPEGPSPAAPVVDGNRAGERFDLRGPGPVSVAGRESNLGQLAVNEDDAAVYVGLSEAMLGPGRTAALFLEIPGLAGRESILGSGASRDHPLARLDLRFEEFRPGWVCLLGDEHADVTDPAFGRAGSGVPLGQGVFRLDADLSPVTGVEVRQFNRSPEVLADLDERDADYMVVTLPKARLAGSTGGGLRRLQLGAVVITPRAGDRPGEPTRLILDTAFAGRELRFVNDPGGAILRPVEIELGRDPFSDADGDGLILEDERREGTDPWLADTDGDRLPDGWEVRFGLNPRDGDGIDGAGGDPDGDGYLNHEEFASATHPRASNEPLRLRAVVSASGLEFVWRAMLGRRYAIEMAERMPGPFVEVEVAGFPRLAERLEERVVLPGSMAESGVRWFRLRESR